MTTYTVTIHKADGSVTHRPMANEADAYYFCRMANNSFWTAAYIGPDDKSHAVRKVYDRTRSPSENLSTMRTPIFAGKETT